MSNLAPEVTRLVLGPLQTNCYLLVSPADRSAMVIDPADDAERITKAAQSKGARIDQILLTHAHPDHIAALPDLRRATNATVLLHRLDADLLRRHGRAYGIRDQQLSELLPDVYLEGNEELRIGQLTGTVIHTPGHTPGSITLRAGDLLFTGDTLFAQGVGRVDLPGGEPQSLLQSIQSLFALPDECTIFPGHGPSSTIAAEKRDNPYV